MDISAIFSLVGSFVILYVAYLQIQNIIINLTGDTFLDLSNELSNNITFFDFLRNNISFIHTNYLQLFVQEKIKDKIKDKFQNTMDDFTRIAIENCMPYTEIVNKESWNGFGKYINGAINGAITSISTTDTSACIIKTTQIYIEKTIYTQQTTVGLLFAQIQTNSRQITNSIYYGIRIGTCSFLYILYRTYPVVRNIRKLTY